MLDRRLRQELEMTPDHLWSRRKKHAVRDHLPPGEQSPGAVGAVASAPGAAPWRCSGWCLRVRHHHQATLSEPCFQGTLKFYSVFGQNFKLQTFER